MCPDLFNCWVSAMNTGLREGDIGTAALRPPNPGPAAVGRQRGLRLTHPVTRHRAVGRRHHG